MYMVTLYMHYVIMKINILLVFLHTLNTKQKYIIIARIPKLLLKKNNFFLR